MASRKKGACSLHCCAIPQETGQWIKESVESGRRKSMFETESRMFGAQCRCGVRRKPPGLSKHVVDDGKCVIHPDKPPEPYVPGVEENDCE